MANHTHRRPHLYLSQLYQCPATIKSVRLPAECLMFIADDMQARKISTFSKYIRALIQERMDTSPEAKK